MDKHLKYFNFKMRGVWSKIYYKEQHKALFWKFKSRTVLFYYIEEALQYEDKNAIWRLFPEAFG